MFKIYLVRHGIATDRIGGSIKSDFDRPLTTEGRHETELVARAIKRFAQVDFMVTSPLTRAKQTAEIFAKVFNYPDEPKICPSLSPGESPTNVYKFIGTNGKHYEIMLFGHEPDMGYLAKTLLWAGQDMEIPFKKAGVCRIDISSLPPQSPGVLKWFINPKIAKLLAQT